MSHSGPRPEDTVSPGSLRRAQRWLSLALVIGIFASPSPPIAVAVASAWLALTVAPRVARWRRSRRHSASAAPQRGRVALGRDPAGRPVELTERQLAAHGLIVGASGSGKSTTLLALLDAQIGHGRPVVAIDMKGSPAFAAQLRGSAQRAGRGLAVWTLDGWASWNPLAHGNPTALKDKLISTERFSEPHYQRAAERYLQTALQVLSALHPERPSTLAEVVAIMEPRRLNVLLGRVPTLRERGRDYLEGLTRDQLSAVRGLGTRLALLSESSAGRWLQPHAAPAAGAVIDLRDALTGGDVVLFSLNASVYGKLAAQVGALAVQDLVSAAGHRLDDGAVRAPATIALDEFSALGADNVLALLARGRESGMSVLLATQELADLERAGIGFRDQVLGITGIKIAHRQEVPASASTIAQMAGTRQVWERTEPLRGLFAAPGSFQGTRRQVERFIVHPNEIKTLPTGHAVLLARLPVTRVAHVQVQAPPVAAAIAASPAASARRSAARAPPRSGPPRDVRPARQPHGGVSREDRGGAER